MNLKGEFSDLVSYSKGDVVRFTGGMCYFLKSDSSTGNPPTDTRYWEWVGQQLQDVVDLALDAVGVAEEGALVGKVANNLTTTTEGKVLDARQGKALKDLIDGISPDAKTLVLASSTASSTKRFAITVDDSGELTATEITEEAES